MLAALLAFVTAVTSLADVKSPRPAGWVSDQAGVIDAADEAKVNGLATELNQLRGIEMAIVTVDDVAGTPKAFATALFNKWGIGNATTNNGILVLLVMKQRRLEIETGTGIATALSSQWLAEMQKRDMVPLFKQGKFGAGVVVGVESISKYIKHLPAENPTPGSAGEYRSDGTAVTPPPPAPTDSQPQPIQQSQPATVTSDSGRSKALEVGVGGAAVGGAGAGAFALRRRRRNCKKCKTKMLPLDEAADDAQLDAGQRKEESIGSVDYEVLVCPTCQDSRTLRHGKWFSGYSRCGSCSYKTLASNSTTIVSATYDHGGQVRVDEDCKHCSFRRTYTKYTSKLTRPSTSSRSSSSSSSSSSGGGSGYSGGSSSGGGAGSSW